MSIFDRVTPEGLNDAYLEEHADMKKYLFFKGEYYAYNDVWLIRYNNVEYVDKRNTDFWDVYQAAITMIEIDLRTTHKKGAANIKVKKYVELRHICDLEKIFFQDIENGKYITYKKRKYYEKQNHYWLVKSFAKYISGIYPLYKYKLNYDYKLTMSIFTDHVADTDDILLKYYNILEGYGTMYPIWSGKNVPAEIIDKGIFYTEDACWIEWVAHAKERIIRDYKIELKNFSKQTYLYNFKKEVQQGNFETRSYNGVTYYRWEDVLKFHNAHDIMSVWRYCKRNRIHWDGPLK